MTPDPSEQYCLLFVISSFISAAIARYMCVPPDFRRRLTRISFVAAMQFN